jgi:hypothetical protein
MLEIKPVSTTYPVVKPVKINKDDHPPNQHQPKKKPVLEEQEPQQPIQHIDEIV